MKMFDRLDDAINPIVIKELRQAVQSRLVSSALLLFLALQLLVLGWVLFQREARSGGDLDFTAGREVFQVFQGILLGSCILFIPLYSGVRLAMERADANVDLLFISTLKPRAIVAGKFFAAMALAVMIFSTCAPFMTFTYLLRGLDIPSIVLILGLDFLVVLLAAQFALLLAVLPVNRWLKGFAALVGFYILLMALGGMVGGVAGFLSFGLGGSWDEWHFWAVLGTIVGGGLACLGVMFVATVALVSPAAANRALMPRIYLSVLWLATAVVAIAWTMEAGSAESLMVWLVLLVLLFCGYLGIAINERQSWGRRVARTIPSRALLRMPAFLLYSGAAGGIAFASLILASTFAVYFLGQTYFPVRFGSETEEFGRGMVILSLYAFNYGLAAVLCRTWLLGNWLKPIHTWVVAAVLIGLGSTIPPLLAYLFFREDFRYSNDSAWWLLPNPMALISALFDSPSRQFTYRSLCLDFTTIWAVVMVAVGTPWFLGQLRRFRPQSSLRET